MRTTTHFDTRMNQRVLRKPLIDLTLMLGEQDGDKITLDPRAIRERRAELQYEMAEIQRQMKYLDQAEKKGGVTVVAVEEALITAYRGNSFSRVSPKKVRA